MGKWRNGTEVKTISKFDKVDQYSKTGVPFCKTVELRILLTLGFPSLKTTEPNRASNIQLLPWNYFNLYLTSISLETVWTFQNDLFDVSK